MQHPSLVRAPRAMARRTSLSSGFAGLITASAFTTSSPVSPIIVERVGPAFAPARAAPSMMRVLKIAAIVLLAIGLGMAALVLRTARRIEQQSTIDEAQPADVILILGAAEYRGKPSPVLRGRLDHGLELYRAEKAPLILTTGGAGGDPTFTEGEVGRDYLVRQGVPSEAILVESECDTTMHSIAAAGEIMRRMDLKSCIVVSDGYHIYRTKKMLEK